MWPHKAKQQLKQEDAAMSHHKNGTTSQSIMQASPDWVETGLKFEWRKKDGELEEQKTKSSASEEHLLLLQRAQAGFPEPTSGGSQLSVIPAQRDPKPSAFCRHQARM